MRKALIIMVLILVCGGAGFGFGELLQLESPKAEKKQASSEESIVFAAGQFTIPLFEGGRVPFFLLAEINIEVGAYDDVSLLSSNRPQVRATILETLFELERRGEIRPETVEPEMIRKAITEDLQTTFNLEGIQDVLLDRLLIQETNRTR